ncbi:MAG: ComEC/Rec2 family competence protein [Spirochaetota bacterium]
MKITPVSYFAYFSLGALVLAPFLKWFSAKHHFYISYSLLFTALPILLFCKKRRSFWLLLGVCFLIIKTFLLQFHFPLGEVEHFSLTEWKSFQKGQIIRITPGAELKKGYRKVEVEIDGVHKKAVWKETNRKKHQIPILLCKAAFTRAKSYPAKMQDYYRFLQPYGDYYLTIREYRCQKLESIVDQKRLIRHRIHKVLLRGGITDHANDISMGLIFGDSGYLQPEFKQKAREGGILHLFAASGLHIGIIIGFLLLACEKAKIFNYYIARILPLIFAFLYLYILSFPVSLTRAYCFALFMVLAMIFFRRTRAIDVIVISAFIIYVFSPENYLSISFLLSFGAVAAILFFKEHMDFLLFYKKKHVLLDSFTLSICASLGTFPVLVYFFQSFSFGSILINLILVPLTSLLLPMLYSSLLWEMLHLPYISSIFWSYTDLLLRVLARLTHEFGERFGFYKETGSLSYENLYLYLGLLGLLAVLASTNYYLKNREEAIEVHTKQELVTIRRQKKINRWVHGISSLLAFVGIAIFYIGGYLLMKPKLFTTEAAYAGSDYYLVLEKQRIYFGGKCKYSQFAIGQILRNGFCKTKVTKIQVESERCLQLALLCQKQNPQSTIQTSHNWAKNWQHTATIERVSNIETRRFALKNSKWLYFYYPIRDPLGILAQQSQKGQGRFVLLFPYKSKDTAKDWNSQKKLLGVNPNWSFIGRNEIKSGISVF